MSAYRVLGEYRVFYGYTVRFETGIVDEKVLVEQR